MPRATGRAVGRAVGRRSVPHRAERAIDRATGTMWKWNCGSCRLTEGKYKVGTRGREEGLQQPSRPPNAISTNIITALQRDGDHPRFLGQVSRLRERTSVASAYIIPSAAPATRTVSRRLIRRDYAAICFDVPSFFSRSGEEEDEQERGEQKDDATAAADGGKPAVSKMATPPPGYELE